MSIRAFEKPASATSLPFAIAKDPSRSSHPTPVPRPPAFQAPPKLVSGPAAARADKSAGPKGPVSVPAIVVRPRPPPVRRAPYHDAPPTNPKRRQSPPQRIRPAPSNAPSRQESGDIATRPPKRR